MMFIRSIDFRGWDRLILVMFRFPPKKFEYIKEVWENKNTYITLNLWFIEIRVFKSYEA